MRGKRTRPSDAPSPARIIPAHAGQTRWSRLFVSVCTDHPRACGANSASGTGPSYGTGSSPRMRGKPAACGRGPLAVRIIPAHAGQTIALRYPQTTCPDHPRACGANYDLQADPKGNAGSSPRMRGKRGRERHGRWCHRIIPAHAGQTRHHQTCRRPRPDHPRACGANKRSVDLQGSGVGSSPRMRGKHDVSKGARQRRRIIPAHAGQTPSWGCRCLPWSDHPRACGANFKTWVKQTENHGSSPRMRGKRVRARASATRARIIPAHAGQTHRMQRGFMAGPDHPRACGANVHTAYQLRFPAGSSPRMRGKRLHDRCHRQRGRIIPAHAGQTFTSENGLASLTDHPRACGANSPILCENS